MNEKEAAAILAGAQAKEDARWKYSVLDPETAPRLAPATNALRHLLRVVAPRFVSHTVAMATLVESSDLALSTCSNLLLSLTRAGALERQGEYTHGHRKRKARDTRVYRLGDWGDQ